MLRSMAPCIQVRNPFKLKQAVSSRQLVSMPPSTTSTEDYCSTMQHECQNKATQPGNQENIVLFLIKQYVRCTRPSYEYCVPFVYVEPIAELETVDIPLRTQLP